MNLCLRNLSIQIFNAVVLFMGCNEGREFDKKTLLIPQYGCTTYVELGKELARLNSENL